MLDLQDISRRGIEESKNKKKLSRYGWNLSQLDSERRQWDESAIHVSDYKVILSDDNKKCERQLWHRLQGDEREDDSLWKQVMFKQGSAMAEQYSYYISLGLPDPWEVYGIEVSCEDYLPNKSDVGSADLVLWNPETTHFIIVEIKTQRGSGIQRIKAQDKPKESHKIQEQGYLYALPRRFTEEYNDRNITVEGAVYYLDREGQNPPIHFPVEPNDSRIEKASRRANKMKHRLDTPDTMQSGVKVSRNKTTNDSLYLDVPWQCQYCEYRGPSCPGAVGEDMEYTKKLGELDGDDVIITADVENTGEYKKILQENIDNGRVTEK